MKVLAFALIAAPALKRCVVEDPLHKPAHDRDMIDLPVGAHPYQREKMAVRRDHSTSREAQTFFEVVERFDGWLAEARQTGQRSNRNTPPAQLTAADLKRGALTN